MAEAGVAADGVVAVQPPKRGEPASRSSVNARRPCRVSRLRLALNDSAVALSAELPIGLIDWRTPAARQAVAKARDVY